MTAHPRSRGENRLNAPATPGSPGSSPLTRGKRAGHARPATRSGLIPAHAGKTHLHYTLRMMYRAHPRSRGENVIVDVDGNPVAGSSPLTRGKLHEGTEDPTDRRLIPAHAGKTGRCTCGVQREGAHPRSRGENAYMTGPDNLCSGSSPLTRGKRERGVHGSDQGRLIPAHAGKTRPWLARSR